MIQKNVKLGNTKGITLIELGKGDVIVGAISSKEDKYAGVEFVNDTPKEIGTKHNVCGTTTDDSSPQAILLFTNEQSIEVVEEALRKAKIHLRNIIAQGNSL